MSKALGLIPCIGGRDRDIERETLMKQNHENSKKFSGSGSSKCKNHETGTVGAMVSLDPNPHVLLCVFYMCMFPWRPEESVIFFGARVSDSCKSLVWVLGTELGLSKEQ